MTQQRPAFPFGQSAPHPEFDPIVQCLGQALRPYRTTRADSSCLALPGTAYEQLVGVVIPTPRVPPPPVLTVHQRPPVRLVVFPAISAHPSVPLMSPTGLS